MQFKSIVAVAAGGAEDAALLAVCARLAARFGAHLRVTPAFPDIAAGFLSYGASLGQGQVAELAARLAESEKEVQERLEAAARLSADQAGLAAGALVVDKRDLLPAVALTRAAALADCVAFSATSVTRDASLRGLFAEALISMSAPTLLLKGDALPIKKVAIAWDGSGQAGRAVRAALPLITQAERVFVLTNVEDTTLDKSAAEEARLRAYLQLHGVGAVEGRALKGGQVAASLLEAARAEGCDLLVAGAYGRPRLQELVLGGSTRAFVNAEGRPSLFLTH